MGAWAAHLTPSTGKYFTMHCGATSGHTANSYLDIAGDQINYEAYTGSYFVFEQANATEGQWYIKDARSNKYLVVANLAADTQVTLSDSPTTYWTTSDRAADSGSAEGVRFMPNGNAGFYLNNNGGFRIKASSAGGGCSTWVLEEVATIPTIQSGWYCIQVDYGKDGYHNGKSGWYVSGRAPIKAGGNSWGMRLSKDLDPTCYVYVTKGDGDNNYTFEFMKDQTSAVTMGFDCQSTSTNKKISLIPTSAGETTKWKIRGNNAQWWRGWELYNVASVGSTGTNSATNNYNYFTITSLVETPNFSPLLPFVAAATVPTINTTKWYNLAVSGAYLVYDAANNKFGYSNTKPADDNTNALFAFVGNQTNGYKIFSYGAGKAFGVNTIATDQVVTGVSEAEAHTYIFHQYDVDGELYYQFEDAAKQDAYLNHLGAGLGYWVNGAYGDDGNRFTIEAVESCTDIVAVEYTMHDNNNSVDDFNVLKFQPNGSAFSSDAPAGGTYVDQSATGTVSPSNRTSTVNYTSVALPFTPGFVYRLGVRPSGDNNTRYCGYRASNGKPLAEQNDDAEPCNEFAAENLWVFERVAGTANQFKLKNLAANAYLAGNGFNAAGTAYTYATTTVNMGSITAEGFTLANGTNPLGNHAGGVSNENHQLGEWSGGSFTDPGSVFWVEAIDEEIPNLTNVGLARSTFLGVKQHPVNASAKTAAAATPNEANVKALFTANFADCVSSSKYYRLANYDTSRSGSNWVGTTTVAGPDGDILSDGRKAQSNVTDGGVAALWQFEESDGAYYLKNVNSGTCLFNSTTNDAEVDLPIDKANAGTFIPSNVSRQWWAIKTKAANEWLHQSNHSDKKLLLWSGQPSLTGSQASLWSIEEVETLPLTIKASKWASMCFPVAVTLPVELTAYAAVKVSTDGIGLDALASKVVPANTPVVITTSENLAAAKTYTLTIGGTADAPATNLFTGTTIARQGYNHGEAFNYGLSNGKFARMSGTTVAANKAFIHAEEDLAPAAGSTLRVYIFDDTLTGINAVEAPAEQGAYYDLNGRMVAYPTTGVYVRNGKKVFVK